MRITIGVILVALAASASGYGGSFLNLHTPLYGLSRGDIEFSMNHRFYGTALKDEPLNTFFGLDGGANVRFGVRYVPLAGVDVGLTHERAGHAYTITAGWSGKIVPVDIELGAEAGITSVELNATDGRESGLVTSICIAARLFGGVVRPVFNYAYDGRRDNNGTGFGLEVGISERTCVFGEYFPLHDGAPGEKDCFSVGARYSTWGHQFLLGFSNSSGIGTRGQLSGAPTDDLSFALSIRRML